jgi:hypothetical protein
MFNPELFLEKMVNLAGNSLPFNTTSTDELLRMALGHELNGLLLNYTLAARQRAEVSTANEKEALVDKNLTILEEDVKAAKEKLEGDVKALKKQSEEEISTLAKDNETALTELATLKQEKAEWAYEKEGLEEAIGDQYGEGFKFALDQIKVLFPDIDRNLMGKADVMLKIEGDKLAPHAPVETTVVEDSPAKE